MMDLHEIRQASLREAVQLGYEPAANLPLLDESARLRPQKEIEDRAVVLCGVVAASYGLPRDRVSTWIEKEGLRGTVTDTESLLLQGDASDSQAFQVQVESLAAFAWALRLVASLQFDRPAPGHLVSVFPDFKKAEPSTRFRSTAKLRDEIDVVRACDLAYCLHWSINQRLLERKPTKSAVPPHVIIERRRALEWMLSSEDWGQVSMDT